MHNGTPKDRIVAQLDAPSRYCLYRTRNGTSKDLIVAQQDAPSRYCWYCTRNKTSEDRIVAQQDTPLRRTDLQDPSSDRTIYTVPVLTRSLGPTRLDGYWTVKTTSHRNIGLLSDG